MNPILAVKLALVPVAVFGIAAGLGHVTLGATAGAVLALAAVLWRRRRGAVPALEWTILATLAAIALAGSAGLALSAADAAALGFLGLSIGAGTSVLLGRPCTGDYSRTQYEGTEADPLLLRINAFLSALWAALLGAPRAAGPDRCAGAASLNAACVRWRRRRRSGRRRGRRRARRRAAHHPRRLRARLDLDRARR